MAFAWAHTAVEKWLLLERINPMDINLEFGKVHNGSAVLTQIVADLAASGVGDERYPWVDERYPTLLLIHPTSEREAMVLDEILRARLWPWAPAGLPIAAIMTIDVITTLGEAGHPSDRDPWDAQRLLRQFNALFGTSISEPEFDVLMMAYGHTSILIFADMVNALTALFHHTHDRGCDALARKRRATDAAEMV